MSGVVPVEVLLTAGHIAHWVSPPDLNVFVWRWQASSALDDANAHWLVGWCLGAVLRESSLEGELMTVTPSARLPVSVLMVINTVCSRLLGRKHITVESMAAMPLQSLLVGPPRFASLQKWLHRHINMGLWVGPLHL